MAEQNLAEVSPQKAGPIRVRIVTPTKKARTAAGAPYYRATIKDNTSTRKLLVWGNAAEQFEKKLQEGNDYVISNYHPQVPKKPQYNSDPVEILLTNSSDVQPSTELLNLQEAQPITLKTALALPADTVVNLLVGVLDPSTVRQVKGKEIRECHITDTSGVVVKLTLWAADAQRPLNKGSILQLTDAKTKVYRNEKSIATTKSTVIMTNDAIPEATTAALRTYMDDIDYVADDAAGIDDTPVDSIQDIINGPAKDYKIETAMVSFVSLDRAFYMGCGTAKCNKKVTVIGNYVNCDNHGLHGNPVPKYMISIKLEDDTANGDGIWLKLFDQHASAILNMPATDFSRLSNEDQRFKLMMLQGKSVDATIQKTIGERTNYTLRQVQVI